MGWSSVIIKNNINVNCYLLIFIFLIAPAKFVSLLSKDSLLIYELFRFLDNNRIIILNRLEEIAWDFSTDVLDNKIFKKHTDWVWFTMVCELPRQGDPSSTATDWQLWSPIYQNRPSLPPCLTTIEGHPPLQLKCIVNSKRDTRPGNSLLQNK